MQLVLLVDNYGRMALAQQALQNPLKGIFFAVETPLLVAC